MTPRAASAPRPSPACGRRAQRRRAPVDRAAGVLDAAGVDDARRHPRYRVSVAAEVVSGEAVQRCELVDLSVGGCRVRPAFPLVAGADVRVRLSSPAAPEGVSGSAVVAWSSGTPPYLAGLRFAPELAEAAARLLRTLLGPIALTNPRRGSA